MTGLDGKQGSEVNSTCCNDAVNHTPLPESLDVPCGFAVPLAINLHDPSLVWDVGSFAAAMPSVALPTPVLACSACLRSLRRRKWLCGRAAKKPALRQRVTRWSLVKRCIMWCGTTQSWVAQLQ